MRISDILKTLASAEIRSTVINWPRHVETIVAGYRSHRGIVHGVQKDAVQNGWDERGDRMIQLL